MNEFYTDYQEYMSRLMPGRKVQKISINTGVGCPNRDGTIGRGGCSYCDNRSFTPSYCLAGDPPEVQLAKGKAFFSRKYPHMEYLAYFQSYTSTYRSSADSLRQLYRRVLEVDGVAGLVIGSRPDTLPPALVEMLGELAREKPVFVEVGVETSCDATLRLVNRGHTWGDAADAIERLAAAGVHVGAHLIAGLPGESRSRQLQSVADVCRLPVGSIKLHQLQLIKGTPLQLAVERGEIEVEPYTPEDYIEFCSRVVATVPRRVAIERFVASAPPGMVVAPRWGIKNHEFTARLLNYLRRKALGV